MLTIRAAAHVQRGRFGFAKPAAVRVHPRPIDARAATDHTGQKSCRDHENPKTRRRTKKKSRGTTCTAAFRSDSLCRSHRFRLLKRVTVRLKPPYVRKRGLLRASS